MPSPQHRWPAASYFRDFAILALAIALIRDVRAAEVNSEFFEKRVRPVLVEHCYDCHGEKKQKGGLRLDQPEAIRTGGDSGPAITPGDVEGSLLIKAVRYTDKDLQMPPPKKEGAESRQLSPEIIADLEAWVRMGAPAPAAVVEAGTEKPAPKVTKNLEEARKQWAFHRPDSPAIPDVKDGTWPRSPLDHFVLAKLEEKGLHPAPPAEKQALLRRATFDLTGLPPTIEECNAFLADESPDAYSRVIDRLLASPRYGERWARHWLDVVRYTDSFDARGLTGDRKGDCAEAWRYRDWVVDALNRDLPYDQFVMQQVAGDLLSATAFDPAKIIATGVYALGNWGGGDADKEKLLTDIADDQVDLTARAFLGLTVACARCHDHKFDPISTEDYYGLAGIFFSTHIIPNPGPKTNGPEMLRLPLLSPEEMATREAKQRRLEQITAELARGLSPMTEMKKDVLGKPGLNGWTTKAADNPSLTINTTNAEIAYLTIKLPAKAISLHPGPKTPVTAAWRSPMDGTVRVSAKLRDADATCGDGVTWEVRHGKEKIGGGEFDNGGQADFAETPVTVHTGELLELLIGPRGNYTCDSTQTDFVIKAGDGQAWDLREAVLAGDAPGKDGVWWICAGEGERLPKDVQENAPLEAERKSLAAELATPPAMTLGMAEGGCPQSLQAGVHDVKVHVRGRYDRLGALVPRHFPLLLAGDQQPLITEGSGRLALARWLASAENPLTARVMVNRIWQHHFGQGIVRTPNNFGKLGEPPTHPELLDWMAGEFVRSGWSIKALHRTIMLSAAYQQSSVPAPETLREDPENRLFGRMSRPRLESEAIRDNLLAVAGTLDITAGGAAFREFATPRRTLYLLTVRSDRGTYQTLFDAADPTAIAEKRIDSTVAPQALFLLNHPFVQGQVEALARRMHAEAPAEETARIDWLYRLLYARASSQEEQRIGAAALARARQSANEDSAWQQYLHALVCANEFIYID